MIRMNVVLLVGMLVVKGLLTGCGDPAATKAGASSGQNLPVALQTLQGRWNAASTNGLLCNLIVDGHTARFQYQQDSLAPLYKRNLLIEHVDSARKLLVFTGNTGAWPYSLDGAESDRVLHIEFFGLDTQSWKSVGLKKVSAY